MADTAEDKRKKTSRNAEKSREENLLFLLSWMMMHPVQAAKLEEEKPEVAQQMADALGFETVEKYQEWKKDHVGDPAAELPPENIRRITRKPDGKFNEEGYARLGAVAKGSLLNLIAAKESGGDYNVVFGGRNTINYNGQKRELTDMTVNEVLDWQKQQRRAGADSTAAGRYQIIYKTLNVLASDMGVGNQKYDEAMQDRMALELLKQRGFDKYLKGEMSEAEFMKKLSQEWASFPKDFSGLSYYHGDGLNKAGVSPHVVLATIQKAREDYIKTHDIAAAAKGEPEKPDKIGKAAKEARAAFDKAAATDKPEKPKSLDATFAQAAKALDDTGKAATNLWNKGLKFIGLG